MSHVSSTSYLCLKLRPPTSELQSLQLHHPKRDRPCPYLEFHTYPTTRNFVNHQGRVLRTSAGLTEWTAGAEQSAWRLAARVADQTSQAILGSCRQAAGLHCFGPRALSASGLAGSSFVGPGPRLVGRQCRCVQGSGEILKARSCPG